MVFPNVFPSIGRPCPWELATALPPVGDDLVSSPARARGSAPALLAELKAELGKGAAQASVTRLRCVRLGCECPPPDFGALPAV